MWMLESNDHGKDLKMSLDHHKLRPLMPRPTSCCTSTKITPFPTISSPSYCCIQNPNNLLWKHQPLSCGVNHLVSTRWNPTPEQLHALEEMFRRGITTPSAEQIQQIAAKLRRFGKIEGKNVFYWFQNHKARQRQKKRRQLELLAGNNIQQAHKKQTGLSRTSHFEFEHQNKLPTPSNSNTLSEDSESMHGAVIAECKKDEWTQLNLIAKEETCWKLDLSSCLSPNNSAQKIAGEENAGPFAAVKPNLLLLPTKNSDNFNPESGIKEKNQTLQLFPTGISDFDTEEDSRDVSCIGSRFRPHEFIEFLPTKN